MAEKIGFIGQGWIGKNYSDHFEARGFNVVRYSAERSHAQNKDLIRECPVVFIAVPTPSTPQGFDDSIVREMITLVGKGKIAVIKSTILHTPEFLRETSARHDVDHPDRHVIGMGKDDPKWKEAAERVLALFVPAPHTSICTAEEAELTKYGSNIFLFWKVIFANIFYDTAKAQGADWDVVARNIGADPRIGHSHLQPVHQMPHLGKEGRGAGGHCFIKDFDAFERHYEKVVGNAFGSKVLEALREKNLHLLLSSEKDLELLSSVYGEKLKKGEYRKNKNI
jgi:UDP-glucose 6-dehydrogenase